MERKVYYKYMFIIGAIWNLAVAIPLLIISYFINPGLSTLGLIYYQGFLISIILFGIGYYIVGKDINKNHAIILLGIVGKILVFTFFLTYFLLGIMTIFEVSAATIDLIFACLFIEFLINFEKVES